ncbi:MAG TPA: Rrf2 family transcriptional regulator [Ignavibacteriales bacterium]|nr:Rrf2 family transcriptional regulator [Ignavibacteriales bacterium]HAZ04223.1 Rrf2 family transcriptional regulator [Marinilabiliales bacterium]HBX85519.1 Rrf2 family transcriptional regulator [Marinilabiliales bacterium]
MLNVLSTYNYLILKNRCVKNFTSLIWWIKIKKNDKNYLVVKQIWFYFVFYIYHIFSMSYSLSFSKAILVVIFISDKTRQNQFEFLSTGSLSEILNIPKPTLVKILQSLTAEGIIETKEGKFGGIRLIKDPSNISVLEILNAVEKGKSLFNTTFDIKAKGHRPDKAQMSLLNLFGVAENKMKEELGKKTIAQILDEMS